MRKEKLEILVLTSIASVMILFVLNYLLMGDYIFVSVVKWLLFLGMPVIVAVHYSDYTIFKGTLTLEPVNFNRDTNTLVITFLPLLGIMLAFLGLEHLIDLDIIENNLVTYYRLSRGNFILYGLYMVFVNSLLEEFFFRGFIFLNLRKLGYPRLAYVLSAGLFSLYHLDLIIHWFSPGIVLLSLLGIFLGGLIFAYLDTLTDGLSEGLAAHVLADLMLLAIAGINFF
ncbi:MAG: hypothetical protein AVO33_08955 [delta proteobacterium ML8_F1]|nr:MAG: hypothetical protein AVO33_08955 [delta proteobacterium ML8_F1]